MKESDYEKRGRLVGLYNAIQRGLDVDEDISQKCQEHEVDVGCLSCKLSMVHSVRDFCSVMTGPCVFYERVEEVPFEVVQSRFVE